MIEWIKSRIETINQANGFLFDVPSVGVEKPVGEMLNRSVSLSRENGCVLIDIKAKTKTLDELKAYICELLDEQFAIEDEGESLIATPKEKPIIGEDDAAT